jgi:acetyltransferase-like isoleucine patch superfamily enzyme
MNVLKKLLLLQTCYARGLRRRIRDFYYSLVLKSMGRECQICDGVIITDPDYTSLGNRVTINERVILQAFPDAALTIGNNVNIAYGAVILTGGLDLTTHIDHDTHVTSPVVIKDNAWIGARAIIFPGITIGEGAGVSAGSLVTQDVEPYTLVFGVPARGIRRFEKQNANKQNKKG